MTIASAQWISLFGSAIGLVVAWQAYRAARQGGAFYDCEVYGMTPVMHLRVGRTAVVVAVVFGVAAFLPWFPSTPIVAIETVLAILYLASFARGASHEDEQ